MRLRHLVRVNPPKTLITHLPGDTEVVFAPMEALADGLGGLDVSTTRPLAEVSGGSYSYFAEGDLLVAKVTPCFENGKKAIARGLQNGIGFATSEVHVIRLKSEMADRRYLNYVFCSEPFRFVGMSSMTGAGGLRRVSEEAILNYHLPVSDLSTQKRIADFLDSETARLDHLIERKQRLVKLLGEKRSSVIDSRFQECISKSSYVALRRFLISMCDGPFGSGLTSSHYVEEGVRVIRLQNIGRDDFRAEDAAFIDPQHYATLGDHDVVAGDLLVAGLGDTSHPVGRACLAPEGIEPAMVKADCFRLRFDQRHVRHHFLAKYLSSPTGAAETARRSKGVTRNRINLEILAGLPIPYLPIETQDAITASIDEEIAKLEPVDSKLFQSIEGLREFRSALITAAVTGQIDVEHWGKRGDTDRSLEEIEEELRT